MNRKGSVHFYIFTSNRTWFPSDYLSCYCYYTKFVWKSLMEFGRNYTFYSHSKENAITVSFEANREIERLFDFKRGRFENIPIP